MLCLLVLGYLPICGGEPFFQLAIYRKRYLIRKLVKPVMNFGKDVNLTWNTLECEGVWLRLCYLSLKRQNLVLEHVIVCLLDMLAIVHVVDFKLSRVIF